MKPKEFLQQARGVEKAIEIKRERIARLKAYQQSASLVVADKNAPSRDKIAKTLEKIEELENKINDDVIKLIETEDAICSIIAEITPLPLRNLLEMRYINHKTFEVIAVEMGYSWRHVHRLHNDALKKIKDVIECHT